MLQVLATRYETAEAMHTLGNLIASYSCKCGKLEENGHINLPLPDNLNGMERRKGRGSRATGGDT